MTATLVILSLCACLVVPAVAAEGAELSTQVWAGCWQLSTWGFAGQGLLAWVGSGQNLRLEVLKASNNSILNRQELEFVWYEQGVGWTLVTDGFGHGTMNEWGQAWKPLDAQVANFVQQLTRRIQFFYRGSDRLLSPSSQLSYVLAGAPAKEINTSTSLRNLIHRGWGQGGPGEIITLRGFSAPEAPQQISLAITSSRRPGTLHFIPYLRNLTIADVPTEVFAPLWSLGEFLKFPEN